MLRRQGLEALWAIGLRKEVDAAESLIRCFEELFTGKAYDTSSEVFQMLLDHVVGDSVANKVLLSLLRGCSRLETSVQSDVEPVLELLVGFGRQLQPFSHLVLWKAYMLALLVKAVLFGPNYSTASFISLRAIIGPCRTIESLDEVPADCSAIVNCGRAFLVSLDAKDGVPLSGMSLQHAFQMAATLMDTNVLLFIHGAFDIVKLALTRDRLTYTSQCYDATLKVVELIFKFYDADCLGDKKLASRAASLWGKVCSLFSFDEVIRATDFFITEYVRSKRFYRLLTLPKLYLKHKWPVEKEGHESTFKLLKHIIVELTGVASYPTCDETSQKFLRICYNRGVDEQLQIVANVLCIYLNTMFKDGETNYTGLFGAEEREQALVWLKELHTKATEAQVDPVARISHNSVQYYVEYALRATADPKFIGENGLPFEF